MRLGLELGLGPAYHRWGSSWLGQPFPSEQFSGVPPPHPYTGSDVTFPLIIPTERGKVTVKIIIRVKGAISVRVMPRIRVSVKVKVGIKVRFDRRVWGQVQV